MHPTKMLLHYEDGSTEEFDAEPYGLRASPEVIEERSRLYPEGTRVKLVALAQNVGGYNDLPNLPPGSTGTVVGVPDSIGSIPIKWDHGASLAATSHDKLEVLSGDQTPED